MLFKKIGEYCRTAGIDPLLSVADTVIVGFSGGADSSVLLSYFASVRERLPELRIIGAHVNHMIRGDEAFRDEEFCRRACLELGVEFALLRVDIPALSRERGKGVEETAREERYSFFEKLSEGHPSAVIATAHNADDNLETLIFHLARGSGTKGLSGISPVREGRYIRPLLSCTSAEIRDHARDFGICYVNDSTNEDTDYTRNAIRHKILPLLRELNPEAARAGLRLSAAARQDCDYIEKEAAATVQSPISPKKAKELHPALFARVLVLLYKECAGHSADLSEKNISDCRRLLASREGGSVSLPSGLAFFADKDRIYVAEDPRFAKGSRQEEGKKIMLLEDKQVIFGDFCILCCEKGNYITDNKENVYNLSLHATLDCDRINGNLFVRCRRPGDTLRLRGVNRKLKKLMCDFDIPRRLRDTVPVIEDGDGPVAVAGIGVRDGCSPSADTKRALELYVYERSKT